MEKMKKDEDMKIRVDPNMPDYSKAPYFVKKLEEANKYFAKNKDIIIRLRNGLK